MRSDRLHWHLITGFGLAVLLYVVVYSCDQKVRTRKGPWTVEFGETTNRAPFIRVDQPFLNITNVQIVFTGENGSNSAGKVEFNAPKKPLPFGKTKFEDLTYLPGSVTFEFFGHEVELLPRTLFLNKKEEPWKSGITYILKPSDKLPPEALVERKRKRR